VADKRRGRGEDAVYFAHAKGTACKDARYHKGCKGRWRGSVSLGLSDDGKTRIRPTVSARTKTGVYDRLKEIRAEMEAADKLDSDWTVHKAVDEWMEHGLSGRAAKTISTNREVLAPLTAIIGETLLSELTAKDVRSGLVKIAATRSTRAVQMAHAALVRAITHAEANDKVGRNVAALIKAPEGKAPGRPSKSLTLDQATAVLRAAARYRLHEYVVLSLLTGARTEELRALRWDHVFLDAEPSYIAVWRSVRLGGDTKTEKSRRTLGLPEIGVTALREELALQDADRYMAEGLYEEHGLVFATALGTPLDGSHVRREFKRVCKAAGIGEDWTPRELRHTFVSLMSESGVTLEEIARLVGHSSTATTEQVYRHELRPVLQRGAEVMDQIFKPKTAAPVGGRPWPGSVLS
jgi:integrase